MESIQRPSNLRGPALTGRGGYDLYFWLEFQAELIYNTTSKMLLEYHPTRSSFDKKEFLEIVRIADKEMEEEKL